MPDTAFRSLVLALLLAACALLGWIGVGINTLPRHMLDSRDLRGIESELDAIQRDVQKLREHAERAERSRVGLPERPSLLPR